MLNSTTFPEQNRLLHKSVLFKQKIRRLYTTCSHLLSCVSCLLLNGWFEV